MKALTFTGMLLALTLTGCGDKKVEFGKLEVRYTDNVTEAEASKLGEFLKKELKLGENEATVKLDKDGDTYKVLMVVVDDYKSRIDGFKMIAAMVAANVFPDAPVELHLTDKYLETREVVKPDETLVKLFKLSKDAKSKQPKSPAKSESAKSEPAKTAKTK